jgi:hypothetical protein
MVSSRHRTTERVTAAGLDEGEIRQLVRGKAIGAYGLDPPFGVTPEGTRRRTLRQDCEPGICFPQNGLPLFG